MLLAEIQQKKQKNATSSSSSSGPLDPQISDEQHPTTEAAEPPADVASMQELSGDEEVSYPDDPDVRVFSVESDHEIFLVPPVPTVRELDKSYRSLARIMHPDKYQNNEWATKAFQRLLNRYERFRATLL